MSFSGQIPDGPPESAAIRKRIQSICGHTQGPSHGPCKLYLSETFPGMTIDSEGAVTMINALRMKVRTLLTLDSDTSPSPPPSSFPSPSQPEGTQRFLSRAAWSRSLP